MAKARPIEGLTPDMTYAQAAALTVRVRAQELVEHSAGVLDTTTIERVHAMRVASRRLRAVLEIHRACFPPELFKPVLAEVKELADALGARRDPDVQLASIEEFARALGAEEQPGIEVFAARLRQEQAAGNEILAAALARMEERDLGARLQELADSAVAVEPEPEPEPVREPEPEAEAPPEPEPEPGDEESTPGEGATGSSDAEPAAVDAGPAPEPEPAPPAPAPRAPAPPLVRAPSRTGLLRVLRRPR